MKKIILSILNLHTEQKTTRYIVPLEQVGEKVKLLEEEIKFKAFDVITYDIVNG